MNFNIYETVSSKYFIQNLTGIGTFLASMISLFTLLILMKQRKDSLRPKIILSNIGSADCISDNGNILKLSWYDGNVTEKNENNKGIFFEILNAGIGVAEFVEIKESFNLKKAIKYLKKHDKLDELSIEFKDDFLTIKTSFDDTDIFELISNNKRELGTFLPIGHDITHKYVFSIEFFYFLSCYGYLKNKYNEFLSIKDFPRFKFDITFKDIEGKKYKSKYECIPFSITSDSFLLNYIKK